MLWINISTPFSPDPTGTYVPGFIDGEICPGWFYPGLFGLLSYSYETYSTGLKLISNGLVLGYLLFEFGSDGSTGLFGFTGLIVGLMTCSLIILLTWVVLSWTTVTIFLYDGLKLILSSSFGYW